MTKKRTRLLILLLPVLAVLAVLANADTLFGPSAAQGASSGEAAEPPPLQQPSPAEPSTPPPAGLGPVEGEGKTVPEGTLDFLKGAGAGDRNPFLTRKEQDLESPDPPDLAPDSSPLQEMPKDLALQIAFITKHRRVATLTDGRRIEEGESFSGGTVVSIEKDRAVVEFKNGRRWVIPMGAAPPPEGKGDENP